MSKTWLVARREYVENLRTKTFWIGILAFPLIIAATFFIARLLEKSKDVRTFAIIDHSDGRWLSQEIEARRARSDMQRILAAHGKVAAEGPKTPADLRAQFEAAKDKLGDNSLGRTLDVFLGMSDADLQEILDAGKSGRAPTQVLLKHAPKFLALAADLDQKELASALGGLGSKNQAVPIDDLGSDLEKVEETLRQRVNNGDLFAYFVIGSNPDESDADCRYVSNNLTDSDLRNQISGLATEIVRERRVARLNLTKEQAASLAAQFNFAEKKISKTGEEEAVAQTDKGTSWAPVAFVYLLWIAVFSIAQMLLTNTIEEKSNRIIEVLLSSVSPHQLMIGKIWGLAATGLTVVGSWVLFALLGVQLFGGQLGAFDLMAIAGNPLYLASFVAYFLAGYLLFAAVLVSIGSVCNSLKEAQNLMQPVILLLIVPLLAMMFVVRDPNGTMARVLTYIPLYTPFLMMNRAGGPPPMWEYVATTALILVTLFVAFWAAGKVFRVGILMTGKPPRLREILGWLRERDQIDPVVKDPAG